MNVGTGIRVHQMARDVDLLNLCTQQRAPTVIRMTSPILPRRQTRHGAVAATFYRILRLSNGHWSVVLRTLEKAEQAPADVELNSLTSARAGESREQSQHCKVEQRPCPVG